MKFRFKLQSLLGLRELLEEQQRRRVLVASSALEEQRSRIRQANLWIASARTTVGEPHDDLSGEELRFAAEVLAASNLAMVAGETEAKRLCTALQRELTVLTETHRRTQMVSKLKQSQFESHLTIARRNEQQDLDGVFGLLQLLARVDDHEAPD